MIFLYIFIGIVVLYLIICLIIFYAAFNRNPAIFDLLQKIDKEGKKFWNKHGTIINEDINKISNMEQEDIYITSKDNIKLHASLFTSKEPSKTFIIRVHGYHGGRYRDQAIVSPFLHNYKYNLLLIDLRGHGESDGKLITFGNKEFKDILCWVDYLNSRFSDINIFIYGDSMGGTISLLTANIEMKNVKAIIADAAYHNAYDEILDTAKLMKLPGIIFIPIIDLLFKIFTKESLKKYDTYNSVKESKYPILFIHGNADLFVPNYNSIENYNYCTSEKELHTFDDCWHCESYQNNKIEYESIIINFIEKYNI